jgi:hypothetical protein
VTKPVAPVVATVTKPVAPVVAPIAPVVAPVIKTVAPVIAPVVAPIAPVVSSAPVVTPVVVSTPPMTGVTSPGGISVSPSAMGPTLAMTPAPSLPVMKGNDGQAKFAAAASTSLTVGNQSPTPSTPLLPVSPAPAGPVGPFGPTPLAPSGPSTPSGPMLQNGGHVLGTFGARNSCFALSAGSTRLGVDSFGPTSEYYLILITPD